MANWCRCLVVIEGNQKEINKLLKDAKNDDLYFSLEKLFPSPDDNSKNDFRIEKWGTNR